MPQSDSDKFIKKFEQTLYYEHEKSNLLYLHGLGRENLPFVLPEISNFNDDKLILEFNFLKDYLPLRTFYLKHISNSQIDSLFYRIGEALGYIQSLSFNENRNRFPNNFFDKPFPISRIHGDFTLNNVLYNPDSDSIAIIDWSMSRYFEFVSSVGPIYWDLSYFLSSLFNVSLGSFFMRKNRIKHSISFLKGLKSVTNEETRFSNVEAIDFVSRFNYYKLYQELYKEEKKILPRIKRMQSQQILNNSLEEVFSS